MHLSGLSDEVTADWALEPGLDAIVELGFEYVELRAADGQWLHDATDERFAAVARRVAERGLKVSGWASKLGRANLDAGGFDAERDDAERVFRLARQHGIPNIRVMGFGRGECDETTWRERTVEHLKRLADLAYEFSVQLVLENHPGSQQWTATPDGCDQVMSAVSDGPLGLLFDPANFASAGFSPGDAFEQLKPWIGYLHVKDRDETGRYCMPGKGVCEIERMVRWAKDGPTVRFVSLEPHLLHHESAHYSGAGFVEAGRRLKAMASGR